MQINSNRIVDELSDASAGYEQALVENDVEALKSYFWASPDALRFGVTEELYGDAEIAHFRETRKINFTDRRSLRRTVTAFGEDFGVVTLEFSVLVGGRRKHGRQSQVWVRLDGTWVIVSAHVSHKVVPQDTPAAFTEAGSALLAMHVAPEYLAEVVDNVATMARIAEPLMAFELADQVEPAPVFRP